MMLALADMTKKIEINICVDDKLGISLKDKWLQKVAQLALEGAEVIPPVEMGLFITDSETVQELNKTYRSKDKPTDVLAFYTQPHAEQGYSEPEFVAAPDGVQHLGEVVISYPQAVSQAQQQGHSVEQELALLVVHGVLHLLGYDHEQPGDRQRMRAKEKEILKKVYSVES